MTSIALCVITYRRPAGLRRLLAGIGALDVGGLQADVTVVVVDNDAAGSARAVADELTPLLPFPVVFRVEPEPGIPFARNAAVRAAGPVDLLGWLDDDEVPCTDWLQHLVAAQQASGADVVIGPSVPQLPRGTPCWVREGKFFERRRFASGTAIPGHYARTSGVLIRRAALPARESPFNEALRFTGGSDRELFVEMERCGARFEWVDEAVVLEWVPETRARAGWIFRRAFRIGNSRSTTLVLQGVSRRRRVKRAGAGGVKVVAGACRALIGAPRGRAASARGIWESCYGAGLINGALQFRYEEYRGRHGA